MYINLYYISGKEVSVDVVAEYAKSNRSTCNGCFVSIDKDTVRIGKDTVRIDI